MKRIIPFVAFSILTLSLPPSLLAQTTSDPLLSWKRLSITAGIEREVLRDYVNEDQAWCAVLPFAYNVLSPDATNPNRPRISLTARFSQPFDLNVRPEAWVGVRVSLWRGAP